MSETGMAELSRREFFDGQETSKIKFCEHCVLWKQKKVGFTKEDTTQRGHLNIYIQIFGDRPWFLQKDVHIIC